jgi:histidinol-phosphatase (PHP family)
MICSTHNHTTGSDGKLTPGELVKKAIELGWDYLYFTDHYKTRKDFPTKYYLKYFDKKYISEIKKLKEKYKDKIKIFLGVEMNWIESDLDWTKKEIKNNEFEFILGSVHEFFSEDGEMCGLEWGKEEWIKCAERFGGPREFVKAYYNQIKLMIKSGLMDSVAHMDHVKLYNGKGDLFDENSNWYKQEILECLDLMKGNDTALEINHSGIRKCNMLFPSEWIVREAKKRNLDITIGLDAHRGEHYSNDYLNDLIKIVKKAGYTKVVRFEKGKRVEEEI